jgi:excinuclease ABC subunit A
VGQAANTLSGGEAQRVKLATELAKTSSEGVLYLLDEPTTGLHHEDVQVLLGVLLQLRDAGHSVVVIEHNLEVIAASDWIIDLGPGGGRHGGEVVAAGPPAELAATAGSLTGKWLARAR